MLTQELQAMKVSIEAEIPNELYEALTHFLEDRKDWDSDRLVSAAIALFLVQNGKSTSGNKHLKNAARVYLDTLFEEVA